MRAISGLRVIGLGNPLRGDDAAGLLVARRLKELAAPGIEVEECSGDPVELIDCLSAPGPKLVVDAAAAGGSPGAVLHLRGPASSPAPWRWTSSHGLGLSEALGLAGALGHPLQVEVYAIVGRRFELGARPGPEVERAVEAVAREIAGRSAG